MPTKSLNFFCTPSEGLNLIQQVSDMTSGHLVIIDNNKAKNPIKKMVGEIKWREMWVVPDEHADHEILDFNEEFVQFFVPCYKGKDLMMGSVGSKYDLVQPAFAKSVFTEAKKLVAHRFENGLWARNRKYGGEKYYPDIWISPGAKQLHIEGIELLPLFGDGFVTYSVDSQGG